MKNNKILKTATVCALALTIGTTGILTSTIQADAGTVISDTTYEKTTLFTKGEIEGLTGQSLNLQTLTQVRQALTKQSVWTAAGYNATDAKLIANRFSASYSQAIGVLRDMSNNANLSLKVVVVNKPYYSNADIGTKNSVTPVEPTTESSSSTPAESTTESSSSTPAESTTDSSSSTPAATKLAVKKIDVEVEYKNKDVEFEYEVKSDGRVKAEYKNEFTGEKLKDAAAQAKIEAIMSGLDIQNSSKSAIANHVTGKLGTGTNFKKFDFETKFQNGFKIDFKIK